MSEQPKYQFLTGLARFVFYGVLTLAIFFGAAVLIFVLRGSSSESNVMPDVTGKYYVDVHEDLNGRLQLRVRLEKRAFNDRAAGLVLSQSIAPGSLVSPREKIQLIVNQPDPLLKMPDLLRASVQNAKASIARIAGDERVYSLTLRAVSEIETDEAPAGTVLAQFPPAGQSVAPGAAVFLLIARQAAPVPVQQLSDAEIEGWTGQNVTVLTDYLNRRGVDYRLTELRQPEEPGQNGLVFGVARPTAGGAPLGLQVYFTAPEERYGSGYERLKVELDRPGACYGEQQNLQPGPDGNLPEARRVFLTAEHGEDEEVELLIYRQGRNRVRVVCGEVVVYDRELAPEYPG